MMQKVLSVVCIVLMMVSGSTLSYASVGDDQVTSQKIKEADGTSGQNTNAGSGVKTNHIQNNAITSAKIADGAVTSGKISPGAVTDAAITGPISGTKLGAHTHSGADIVDSTVSTVKIQDGAVTGEKISLATIGIERMAPLANTKIVHTGVADNVNTFNSIMAAANALPMSGGVVKIMPGVYIEDMSTVNSSNVTLEGSGQDRTKIIGNTVNNWYSWGELNLKDLTLDFTFVNGQTGINATNVVFTGDVTSLLQLSLKGSTINGNIYIGNFYGFANSSILDTVINGGLLISNTRAFYDPTTTVLIKNSTITGSVSGALYGISVYLRNATVINSSINGANLGIGVNGSESRLEIVGSKISGASALSATGGLSLYAATSQFAGTISEGTPTVFRMVHCYDADYNPLPNR